MISVLADRAGFQSRHGGGTDVRMSFDRGGHGITMICGPHRTAPQTPAVELSGDVVLWLSPVALLPSVLGRLCRATAATSRFSLERFAGPLLADATARRAALAELIDELDVEHHDFYDLLRIVFVDHRDPGRGSVGCAREHGEAATSPPPVRSCQLPECRRLGLKADG